MLLRCVADVLHHTSWNMEKKKEISKEVQVVFSGACDWDGGRYRSRIQK